MSERIYGLIDLPAEVHTLPGDVRGAKWKTDRPHELSPDCDCKPVVFWNTAAAPRPMYEHRDARGRLQGDAGGVQ